MSGFELIPAVELDAATLKELGLAACRHAEVSAFLASPKLLSALVGHHVSSYDTFNVARAEDFMPPVTSFCGGLLLKIDGETVIEPECCADLSDITNWWEVAKYRGAERKRLWVGHPEYEAVYQDQKIAIFYAEDAEWGAMYDRRVPLVMLEPDLLESAISDAFAIQEKLAEALTPLVGEKLTHSVEEVCRSLAGVYHRLEEFPSWGTPH